MAASSLADTLGGRVFDDLNRNCRADPDEPRFADAHVSNGRNLALTDESGACQPRMLGIPRRNAPGNHGRKGLEITDASASR